jgi:hypothetical protein
VTWADDKAKHTHRVVENMHFLGETLFRARVLVGERHNADYQVRYFVCGLDRNDNPRLRKFYLAMLPIVTGKPLTSVDKALDLLKPQEVKRFEWQHKEVCPRQGEWFFIPVRTDHETAVILQPPKHPPKPVVLRKQETLLSGDPVVQYNEGTILRREREGRHVVARIFIVTDYCKGAKIINAVYAKGKVRDREHDLLYLDGWHRVVRNTAEGSWTVDKQGPKVD